jgi:hypothetical protein
MFEHVWMNVQIKFCPFASFCDYTTASSTNEASGAFMAGKMNARPELAAR